MHVNRHAVQTGAQRTTEAATRVTPTLAHTALTQGAAAVPGGELASAFAEVAPVLERRLTAFRRALEGTSEQITAALVAYDNTDTATREDLARLAWRAE